MSSSSMNLPMVDGGANFAETWRRRRACKRCRKAKVRCEYDSPRSIMCKRCAKAGAECVVESLEHTKTSSAAANHSSGNNNADSGLYDDLGGPVSKCNVTSRPARMERIKELKETIATAQVELEALRDPSDKDGKHGEPTEAGKNNSNSDSEKNNNNLAAVDGGKDGNAVREAINAGHLTESEARTYYGYLAELSMEKYIPFSSSLILDDFDKCCEQQPLAALSLITGAAAFHRLTGMNEFQLYVEGVLSNRLIVYSNLSLDLVRALTLLGFFIQPWPTIKTTLYLSLAISMAVTMNYGDEKDVADLYNYSRDSEEWSVARQRVQMMLSLNCVTLAISINTGTDEYASMINVPTKARDALYTCGCLEDKHLVHTVKTLSVGKESIYAFNNLFSYKQTSQELKAMLDREKKKLSECVESAKFLVPVSERNSDKFPLQPLMLFESQMRLILNEAALNRIVYQDDRELLNLEIARDIANEIMSMCRFMIDSYLKLVNHNRMMPKYVYVRSVQAVIALARVAVIYKSLNEEVPTDISSLIDSVVETWNEGAKVSYNLQNMRFMYTRVERILKLRQLQTDNGNIVTPMTTAGSLNAAIKSHMRKEQEQPTDRKRKWRRIESDYWVANYKNTKASRVESNEHEIYDPDNDIFGPYPPQMNVSAENMPTESSPSAVFDSSTGRTSISIPSNSSPSAVNNQKQTQDTAAMSPALNDSPLDEDTMNKLLSELFSEVRGVTDF